MDEGAETSSNLDEVYRPRMKLFFSADIVGSTKYKQPFRIDGHKDALKLTIRHRRKWQELVRVFYAQLRNNLARAWDDMRGEMGLHREDLDADPENFVPHYLNEKAEANDTYKKIMLGYGPNFWKTVGDEILFWKQVDHEHQLWASIAAWVQAIDKARPILIGEGLDVKCTLWLAEFPVRNALVVNSVSPYDRRSTEEHFHTGLPSIIESSKTSTNPAEAKAIANFYRNGDSNDYNFDFIGPGIDTGFRVAKFATTRNMAISLDLAYLLALSHLTLKSDAPFSARYGPEGTRRDARTIRFSATLPGDVTHAQLKKMAGRLLLPEDLVGAASKSDRIFDLKIHYDGSEPLKGLLGNIDYPQFWIDISPKDSMERRRSAMEGVLDRGGMNWQQVLEFCLSFYFDRQGYLRPPTLVASGSQSASCVATWVNDYDKCLVEVRKGEEKVTA
jgi:hypothetical protein